MITEVNGLDLSGFVEREECRECLGVWTSVDFVNGRDRDCKADFREANCALAKHEREVARTARGHECRAASARYQAPRRGARDALRDLQLVHRGLRYRRPEGRQGAARRTEQLKCCDPRKVNRARPVKRVNNGNPTRSSSGAVEGQE